MDSQPVWVTVVAAVITLVGGAALGFWGRLRRQNIAIRNEEIEAKGKETKAIVEGQHATADLEIRIRNDAIETWRKTAEDANRRANDADARADRKDEECGKRMESLVTRYRDREMAIARQHQEREAALTKQHQEREMQFQTIVDRIRAEQDAKIDAQNAKIEAISSRHEDCLRDNGELRGRLGQVEERLAEAQSRLDARDMRRGGK